MIDTIDTGRGRHLTDEELARMVECGGREGTEDWMWDHIRDCDRCFDAFQEAAVYRGLWESDGTLFESTEELVSTGLPVAGGGLPEGADRSPGLRSGRGTSTPRPFRYASVIGAAATLFIIWSLMQIADRSRLSTADEARFAPVRTAVETITGHGAFVLPGGERGISSDNGAVYRSGYVAMDDSLRVSLASMFRSYRSGDYSSELIYWLIAGYIAIGEISTARELTAHARSLDIDDPRIAVADAIISFASGDHDHAEGVLRDLLRTDPGNHFARIDIAVVLMQRGGTIEAEGMLTYIIDTCEDEYLLTRARALLAKNRTLR